MKVAVLSCAHDRARTYAKLLNDMPDVELVIADPDDPACGRAVADRLGASYLDDYDEVFAEGVDGVVVTGAVDGRRELVERASKAQAHVLCELPLAVTEADARAVVEACEIGGVTLTIASPTCLDAAFTTVRRGIADGVLGTVTTVHGFFNTRTGAGAERGALGANAPYLLDLVDTALGGEPAAQVYAQTNAVLSRQSGVESSALVTVRYGNGIVASIDCSRTTAIASGPALTFVGDRASVAYDAAPALLRGFDADRARERVEPGGSDLYAVLVRSFLGSIEQGAGDGPDGALALRTMRIVAAAYESAHTGQPVDLGLPA
jgi:predicted dehydrogenase